MEHETKSGELAAISDPVERLTACSRFLVNGRLTISRVLTIRDEAIQQARTSHPDWTRDQLAALTETPRGVVVDALRKMRKP